MILITMATGTMGPMRENRSNDSITVVSGTLELDNKSRNFSAVPSCEVPQVFGVMKNSLSFS